MASLIAGVWIPGVPDWYGPVDVYLEAPRVAHIVPSAGAGRRRFLVPGFIDLHVHGGGGYDFLTADRGGIYRILQTHRAGGTMALLATLVSASPPVTRQAIENIISFGPAREEWPELLGIHWEGPLINPTAAGALTPVTWSVAEIKAVIEEYYPWIKIVTLAPEMPGALTLLPWLRERGVVVSIGHSLASLATFKQAVAVGATRVTHLFNAMRPWHHREPGVAGAALITDEVVAELIPDPAHLHPAAVQMAYRLKGSRGLNLVTDAMAAAGMPDGSYYIGDREVEVTGGQARLADGRLAGSVLTMDQAIARAVASGIHPVEAVAMATLLPAASLGLTDRGQVAPGMIADLLLVDSAGRISTVWVRGRRLA